MKNVIMCIIAAMVFAGCSSSGPGDDALVSLIEGSMKNKVPMLVVGNMLGGKLESLESIEIEKKENKEWKPNSLGQMLGMKPYKYVDVTAVVKGTAMLGDGGPVTAGEHRGFHSRHIWRVRKNDKGQWYVNVADDFTRQQPAQPADPHWWTIK